MERVADEGENGAFEREDFVEEDGAAGGVEGTPAGVPERLEIFPDGEVGGDEVDEFLGERGEG